MHLWMGVAWRQVTHMLAAVANANLLQREEEAAACAKSFFHSSIISNNDHLGEVKPPPIYPCNYKQVASQEARRMTEKLMRLHVSSLVPVAELKVDAHRVIRSALIRITTHAHYRAPSCSWGLRTIDTRHSGLNGCPFGMIQTAIRRVPQSRSALTNVTQRNLTEITGRQKKMLLVNWRAFNRFNLIILSNEPLFRAWKGYYPKLACFAGRTTILNHWSPPKIYCTLAGPPLSLITTHVLQRCFDKPQGHKIYLRPALHSFFTMISC